MAKFEKGNTASKGRPRGAKGKNKLLSDDLTAEALKQLSAAVFSGEQWGVIEVLKRVSAPLKPVTDPLSLDGLMLQAKIDEFTLLEERIAALELTHEKH